jgi:hypothetical protein
LLVEVDLHYIGYVSFTYKVVASGMDDVDEDAGFYFEVNSVPILERVRSTQFNVLSELVMLKPGKNTLLWKFHGGVPPSSESAGYYAIIDKIIIFGTDSAARQSTPCREGFYQDLEKQVECKECPANTHSSSGQASCIPCPPRTYSLPTSSDCELERICTRSDFSESYSSCRSGKWTKIYQPLLPKVCSDENEDIFGDNFTKVECPDCPPGFFEKSIVKETFCSHCSPGEYLKGGKCVSVPPGSRSNLKIKYFDSQGIYLYWKEQKRIILITRENKMMSMIATNKLRYS